MHDVLEPLQGSQRRAKTGRCQESLKDIHREQQVRCLLEALGCFLKASETKQRQAMSFQRFAPRLGRPPRAVTSRYSSQSSVGGAQILHKLLALRPRGRGFPGSEQGPQRNPRATQRSALEASGTPLFSALHTCT